MYIICSGLVHFIEIIYLKQSGHKTRMLTMKVAQKKGCKSNIQADTLHFEIISWSWRGIFHAQLQFHSLI